MPEVRRTALVTGGARRVGAAIVQTLADAGFDVMFTTRSQIPAAVSAAVAVDATPGGGRIVPINLDVADVPESADLLLLAIEQSFGRLDVLVHNASSFESATLAETDLALIRRLQRVHIEVPLLLTRQFASMLRASRGHVIMMLDSGIDRPMPRYVAYNASKAALANLTLSLARELAPEVTVNGIAPGVIEWPADFPIEQREKYLSRVPLGRAGVPGDAAALVKFLVTEGNYITGQIIRVDGGRSIGT